MRIIKLMPKANEDLEGIWYYSYHHFGEPQADRYVEHLSDVLQILSNNNIGTPRPELGEGIFVLPFERHVIYFLQSPGKLSSFVSLTKTRTPPDIYTGAKPADCATMPALKVGHSLTASSGEADLTCHQNERIMFKPELLSWRER